MTCAERQHGYMVIVAQPSTRLRQRSNWTVVSQYPSLSLAACLWPMALRRVHSHHGRWSCPNRYWRDVTSLSNWDVRGVARQQHDVINSVVVVALVCASSHCLTLSVAQQASLINMIRQSHIRWKKNKILLLLPINRRQCCYIGALIPGKYFFKLPKFNLRYIKKTYLLTSNKTTVTEYLI